MEQPLYIVDTFTDRLFSGNPAAVCPLEFWLPDEAMQAIASEINLAETAFFVPKGTDFEIRWFTPTREVDHIGHATLAAGHIVFSRLTPSRDEATFCAGEYDMKVTRMPGGIALDMPSLKPSAVSPPDGLNEILGATPISTFAAKHYLFVFADSTTVANLKPDLTRLAGLDLPAVIVTARGGDSCDFVSRFFAPANGVAEDHVSGVAHCCLAPYWSERLGRKVLVGRQLSSRGGLIHCEDRGARVLLAGQAKISLEGKLNLPAEWRVGGL